MKLDDKIRKRTCRYGIVGLGYVGLPLAIAFAKKGIRTTGFDVDTDKVASIGACRSYIPDVATADLTAAVKAGTFDATTDFSRLRDMDVISICVPTPLSKSRDPDVSFVAAATESVKKALRPEQLVVLESTTYPGMTEEFCRPALESTGLLVGRDIWLAFSPERVDPGNTRFGVENTPKVVGGVDEASTQVAAAFYRIAVADVREVSSAAAAEMAKVLLENTFRSINIALVNEVAMMCDRLRLDVGEVIGAAASKPFGFMRFDPGPGTGGHCIPLDPLYLSWKLRTLEYRARFVELADDVNTGMPRYVADRVASALNEEEKSIKGSQVLVLGVAYKKDVDDVRESPALEVIRHLQARGAQVSFSDPYIDSVTVADRVLAGTPLTREVLEAADAVVVTTNHTAFPWDDIAAHARLIVDTRGSVPRGRVRGTLVPLSGPAFRGPGASGSAEGKGAAKPAAARPARKALEKAKGRK